MSPTETSESESLPRELVLAIETWTVLQGVGSPLPTRIDLAGIAEFGHSRRPCVALVTAQPLRPLGVDVRGWLSWGLKRLEMSLAVGNELFGHLLARSYNPPRSARCDLFLSQSSSLQPQYVSVVGELWFTFETSFEHERSTSSRKRVVKYIRKPSGG